MQVSYTIDSAANLIRLRYSGKISVIDQLRIVEEILAHPEFRRGMNTLSDLTYATYDWNLRDMDKFRDYLDKLKEKTGAVKWAIISTGGITHMTVKVFLLLHEAFGDTIDAKMFSSMRDAELWLSSVDTDSAV